jgi:hypothetical protein
MKQDTYIVSNWSREVEQQKRQAKESKKERYYFLKEFRESCCDFFDMADFYYYAEKIGCNVSYLLNCAKYSTDIEYKKYLKPARNLQHRIQFYKDNGHSITKPFIWC